METESSRPSALYQKNKGKAFRGTLLNFRVGDFYTRAGLDLQTRELLILCVLCALGGTDLQIKSHATGNLKVGNSRDTLVSAITFCLPFIGFPRTLNAINIVKDVSGRNRSFF